MSTDMSAKADNQDGKLNAEERKKLPSHLFADPETRQEPLEDEGHVRAAMSRFAQTHFPGPAARKAAFHRIVARAHELGMDPSGFEKEHGEMSSKKDDDFTGDPAQYQDALAELKKLKDALEKAEMDRDNAMKDAKALREGMDATVSKAVKDALDAHAAKAAQDAKEAAEKAVADARKDADDTLATKVAEKVELLARANQYLPEDKRVDAHKSDRDIKLAVIKHVDGDDCEGKSDAYVDGMYDGALKRAKLASDSRATARIVAAGPNAPAPAPEHADASAPAPKLSESELRDRAAARASAAWQRNPVTPNA